MNPGDCPSEELLQIFHEGTLSDHQAEIVGSHLEACSSCQEQSSDFLRVPDPREAPAFSFSHEAGYEQASKKIRQLVSEPARTPFASAFSFPTRIGNYELLSELGAGGMGVVYLARHSQLDRLVAVKILASHQKQIEEHRLRFQREIKAIGKLDHPNIVRALDADTWEDNHFLIMEYVPGIDLSKLVQQVGQLPVPDACELIRQAALGLSHAHGRGMIHRDVKPSNIMLMETEDGEFRVKILDLGLAQLSHHESIAGLTSVGQMMGTLEYMAPEQGEDSRMVQAQADVYSLGCTFYKLLVGEAPFPASRYNTPIKLMKALATESPPSISEKRSVPQELAELVDSMLTRDPADRPATCAEVAERLIPFAEECDLAKFLDQIETCDTLGTTPVGKISQSEFHETLIHQNVSTDGDIARPQQRPPSRSFTWFRLVLALSFAGILLAGIVLFLPAKNGFVRIEILDPSIQVTMNGEDRYLVNGKEASFEIVPGKHSLHIKSEKLNFKTQQFDVTKGNTTALRVSMVQGNRLRVLNGEQILDEYTIPKPKEIEPLVQPPSPVQTPSKEKPESKESLAISKLNRAFVNQLLSSGNRTLTVRVGDESKSYHRGVLPPGGPVRVLTFRTYPGPPLSEEEFQLMVSSRLEDLQQIRFQEQQIPAEWLETLHQVYPDLLELFGFPNNPQYFAPMSRFKKLIMHSIVGTTSEQTASWTQMLCDKPDLKYIHYHMSRVDQNVLDILAKSPRIEKLGFMKESFGDDGIRALSKIKTLKTLRFEGFRGEFSREALMLLAGHPNLKEIIIKARCPAPLEDILDLLKTLPGGELQIDIPGLHDLITQKSLEKPNDPD